MTTSCISFRETGYFSDLICDYLDENDALRPFYNQFSKPEDFQKQIEEKKRTFPEENRAKLINVLQHQYQQLNTSELTLQHIEKLKNSTTFTVTTGHQLNIFTGPLYFFYKIITAINLAKQLKALHPDCHFVPVYWMATEDHDFEEISFFNYKGKKLQWQRNASGAVGELTTEGLEKVLQLFDNELTPGKNATALKQLFENAYLKHHTLADATRYLVNELFGEYGLVIIDANEKELKKMFIPYIEDELQNETSFKAVSETASKLAELSSTYKIQVQPRECNLFYLNGPVRERIIRENDMYYVNDTDISFTAEEISEEVKNYPERFSPNVIMRPLYQEVILPDLCYIGGGGELAYWLELKAYFDAVRVPFPILMLRNSALIIAEKQVEKLKKLNISIKESFLKCDDLVNRKVKAISDIPIDFTPQKEHLQQQFEALYELAGRTDKSFLGAVKAQEVKQLKGLHYLEKRLLKAQKKKEAGYVNRVGELHQLLFPSGSLQERTANFSEFYMEYGTAFIKVLIDEMKAFKHCFLIVTL